MRRPKSPSTDPTAYRVSPAQRRLANRELDYFVDALCHDHQYSIQRCVRLIRILALPKRITYVEAFKELERVLAVTRSKNRWGRPWTMRQIERAYWWKPKNFTRDIMEPVTDTEIASVTRAQYPRNRGFKKKGAV